MGDSAQRAAHIKDATDFFAAVDNGTLPAVSLVKPDGLLDGHPASSKEDLFEGMVKKIMDHLTANQELFASTVLFITMDEGGGRESDHPRKLPAFWLRSPPTAAANSTPAL